MVKFRRSLKSDKSDSKATSLNIPQKDAIAIVPPKKVIRALYDYTPETPGPGYLSFSAGDFLHVVGREDDEDWYEACNPLQNARGLVPVKFFGVVNKDMRDSGGSTASGGALRLSGSGHDSGYGESTNSPPGNNGITSGALSGSGTGATMSGGNGGVPRTSKGSGAMLYGVVQYDFKAERADELDAKEGEAIIVIAQSNPQWFVAKPITRLGGPGLIPVSFIEIRDMSTGKAVKDANEAVARAGVPKVEEWKKMAAEYKNGSIPLGKLDAPPGGLEQSMGRMNLQSASGQQQSAQSGYGQQQYQQPGQQYPGYAQPPQQAPMLAPISASVPRYCFADDIFWFIVECQMEDGRHWELQRLYQDFYDLQINLIQEFPREAGNKPGYERSLPFMPGPVTYVTDNISNGRRANLDEYIRDLLQLGPHITNGYLVRKFFAPRDNDFELDPNVRDHYRLSASSQQSGSGPSNTVSQQSSAGNLSNAAPAYAQVQQPSGYPAHRRNQSSVSPPMMPRQVSNVSAGASSVAGPSSAATSSSLTQQQQQATKIKVRFSDEDAVIIRLPPVGQFRFVDLYKKLKERHMLDYGSNGAGDLSISWKDEMRGIMVRVDGDESLNRALERTGGGGGRLVLDVRVTR